MKILDSRRLRGPSLDARGAAAIAEIELEASETPARAVELWRTALGRMATELRRPELAAAATHRSWAGGLALVVPGPIDVLLAIADLNEWAVEVAARSLSGKRPPAFEAARRKLARRFREESRPLLLALERAARAREVPFLWDDDEVTLGHGARARTWPIEALPREENVDWSALSRMPLALVTGTNGKTTTTRLSARMAKLAGLTPGHTSSDGVAIDEKIVEAGDWTGAEAARLVLRHPDVRVAFLETARGGILRRGLAVDRADAAVVTNVAADHLGEHGVGDLDTMTRVKMVCAHVVPLDGRVILNALDPHLRAAAASVVAEVVYFAREPSPFLLEHVAAGGHAFVLEGDRLVHRSLAGADELAALHEVPITFGGAARHNVDNVLAASALAWSLGLPRESIVLALRTFGSAPTDNPGRGTVVDLGGGVRGLFDFAHNAAGMRELHPLARALAGTGTVTHVGTIAGDRSDADHAALGEAVVRGGAKRVVLWESEGLLRGRAPGETRALLRRGLVAAGLAEEAVLDADTEADALALARAKATPGDVIVVAPNMDRTLVGSAPASGP